jgi:hypothetical protein
VAPPTPRSRTPSRPSALDLYELAAGISRAHLGAGKTTAMRIVLGVLAPDAGEVRWRGRPMNREMRQRFGYMPEDHGQTSSPLCARLEAQ